MTAAPNTAETPADTATSLSILGLRPDQVARLRSIRDEMYGWEFNGFAIAEFDGFDTVFRMEDLNEESCIVADAFVYLTRTECDAEIARMLDVDRQEWEDECKRRKRRGMQTMPFEPTRRYAVAIYQRDNEWDCGDASCAPVA
jgi:hypothetical protein